MQTFQCPACQATIQAVPGQILCECPACHQKYSLKPQLQVQPVSFQGGVLFQAAIPAGWQVSVFPEDPVCSKDACRPFGMQLSGPEAVVQFYPKAYFRDGRNESPQYSGATLINSWHYLPAEAYVRRRLQMLYPQAVNLQMRPLKADALQNPARSFLAEAAGIMKDPQLETGKFEFYFDLNGQTVHGLFGVILCTANLPKFQQTQPEIAPSLRKEKKKAGSAMEFFMRGGLVGAAMRHEEVPDSLGFSMEGLKNSLTDLAGNMAGSHNWGRGGEFIVTTYANRLAPFNEILDAFASSLQYGPMYSYLEQQEAQALQNIMMQGAMQRQQIQQQASQRLSQTISQRNNIIMSTYENRRAANDRMSRNFSEAIRGVNSYTDAYGNQVEASVRYDHVYTNGTDYVASDSPLEPGVGWDELKRNR